MGWLSLVRLRQFVVVVNLMGLFSIVSLIQGCATPSHILAARENVAKLERIELIASKGEMAYQAGQYEKSASLWQQVETLDGSNIKALYRLGNINFRLGKTLLAREYYEKTVDLSPRYSKAHYNLAVINMSLAEEHFKYYAATSKPHTDLDSITELLGHIDQFKLAQKNPKQSRLDRLTEQLRKK